MQLSLFDVPASPLRPPPPDPDAPAHRWRKLACEAKRACLPWPSWIRVACPECGASIGQPCTLRSGELLSPDPWASLHRARADVAYALRTSEAHPIQIEDWPGMRWLLGDDTAAGEMLRGWIRWRGMPAEVEA